MCGRYWLEIRDPSDLEIENNWEKLKKDVYPGETAPVILKGKKGIMMKWGYPYNGKLIINARSETLKDKLMFKKGEPVIVIASGFYEWNALKEKVSFTSNELLYMAGIAIEEHFCIITTSANNSVRDVHDRMPLILDEKEMEAWLNGNIELLNKKPQDLIVKRTSKQISLF